MSETAVTAEEGHAEEVLDHAEHFQSYRTEAHAWRLGMWSFLASEMLIFAGLFGLYTAYRVMYPADFHIAATHTNKLLGSTNTVILILSSCTVAAAVYGVRHGKSKTWVTGFLGITILFALGFLVVKSFEYREEFHHGIFPGFKFYNVTHQELIDQGMMHKGVKVFFTLYFIMTGLHALHVIIGMGILAFVLNRARKGYYTPERHLGVELGGMYWHLVDLIWIFLWPMLYLVE